MKHHTPYRFRFWTYTRSGWVRLSLKDGQSLEFTQGGRTDEGYSYTTETYSRIGEYVYCNMVCNASDCDGPLDEYYSGRANILTDTCDVGDWEHPEETYTGLSWTKEHRSRHDHFAEAAGY